MNATAKRSGVDLRIAALAALVLLLALGGAATWAYTTNADLEATRQTLATTSTDLESTKQSLTDTEGKLTKATSDVAAEQETIATNKTRLNVLEFQISRKDACIKSQTANLAEIRRILEMERANFDRTTSGSAWNKANLASNKALDLAITYRTRTYTSAAAGAINAANSWLKKSNDQIKVSNNQIKIGNREIDKFNVAVDEINKANDAFGVTLDKTSTTCGS